MSEQRKRASPEVEMLQRVRRIETRVTTMMIAMGVDSSATKPVFDNGRLTLPSKHCSVKEILEAIPADWGGPVGLLIGDERLAEIDIHSLWSTG